MEPILHLYSLLHKILEAHCEFRIAYDYKKLEESEVLTIKAILDNQEQVVDSALYQDIQYPYFSDILRQYVLVKNALIEKDSLPQKIRIPLVSFSFDSYYLNLKKLVLAADEMRFQLSKEDKEGQFEKQLIHIQKNMKKIMNLETAPSVLHVVTEIFINQRFKIISGFYKKDFSFYVRKSNDVRVAEEFIKNMDSMNKQFLITKLLENLPPSQKKTIFNQFDY